MTKKTIVFIVALMLIISLFIGCQDNLIERLEKVQAHITISTKLPDKMKTDDFDPDSFVYILKWYPTNDKTNITQKVFEYTENLAVVFKFDPGEYTFELSAIVNDVLKAHGQSTVAIDRGQRDKLDIPLTYYIYGDKGGFTVGKDVITLSGTLKLGKDETISIPSDKKLVIEDGSTIDVGGTGSTLTFNGGIVETLGDLTVKGNLALAEGGSLTVNGDLYLKANDATLTIDNGLILTVEGDVYTDGDLTLFGKGKLTVNGNLMVDQNLNANNEQLKVSGDMSYNYLISEDNPELLVVHVPKDETRSLDSIAAGYTSIKVTGGGTLTITGGIPQKLEAVGLEDGSTLQIGADGDLGALECVIIIGEGSLKAATITADTIETASDKSLKLVGDVLVQEIIGSGVATVDGMVTAGTLSIADGATLEASSLVVAEDTLEITDGGTLKVSGSANLSNKDIVLSDDSKIVVTGELESDSISGAGTVTAGSVTTGTISNDDNLSITATTIDADAVELGDGKTLTLNGNVTTDSITGDGSLAVDGDLSLTAPGATTLTIANGATIMVTGDVDTAGALTVSGSGTLDITGELDVEGNFTVNTAEVSVRSLTAEADGTLGTLTIGSAGFLEIRSITGTTKVGTVVLAGGSALETGGALTATTSISGAGTVTAGSVTAGSETTTGTISSNTGNLTITATTIEADAVELGDGKTLTLNGNVTTDSITGDGSLSVDGDLSLTAPGATTLTIANGATIMVTGDVDTAGALTVSGSGTLDITGELDVEGNFMVNTAEVSVGSLTAEADGTLGTLTIGSAGFLEIRSTTGTTKVDTVVLAGGSALETGGALTASTSISGDGTVTAGSVTAGSETTTGTISSNTGNLTITATTIEADAVVLKADKALTLNGNATTDSITGDGSLAVTGNLELSATTTTSLAIATGETITVTGSVTAKGSLAVSGGGTLDADALAVKGGLTLADGATVDVNGALTATTSISGAGTVTAGSVTAGTISNTGDLSITATTIDAGAVELGDGKTLTLNGNVTTGEISGTGSLVAGKIVGADGDLGISIKGSPSVTGDLTLASNTTLAFDNEASLTVTGEVKAWGDLTLTGNGTLEVGEGKKVRVEKGLNYGDDFENKIDDDSVDEGNPPYGIAPHFVVDLENTTTTLKPYSELGVDWETVTLIGSGQTFKILDIKASLEAITLGENSKLEVGSSLTMVAPNATLALGNGSTLTVVEDKDIEAEGNLILSGKGALEAKKDLTVTGNFITESDVDVTATLDIKGDAKIDGSVHAGTLELSDGKSVEITGNGSLTVDNVGTTKITDVKLSGTAALNVTGTLESTTVSGGGTITASIINASTISGGGTITASTTIEATTISGGGIIAAPTLTVTTLDTEATKSLSITGNVTLKPKATGSVTVEPKVTGSGTVTVNGNATVGTLSIASSATLKASGLNIEKVDEKKTLAISGGGTLVDTSNTNLASDTIVLVGGSTLEIDSTKTLTSTTIAGEGTIKAKSITATTIETTAGKTMSLDSDVTVAKVTGTGTVKVSGKMTVAGSSIEIAKGATLEVKKLDPTITSLTIAGGGTLKIADGTTLNEIVLKDGSTLEIAGSLTTTTTTIDLSPSKSGTLVVNGKLTTADLKIPKDVTLDVSKGTFDIKDGTTLHVDGTLQLGTGGWDLMALQLNESIVITGAGDIKKGGAFINWYTLYGAEAQYTRVAVVGSADIVQIRFLEGSGEKRVTPRITGITPTEPIVRVGTGAFFEVTENNKLNLNAVQLILETGSTTKIGENWWNAGTTFVFKNGGSVTANAGAIVTHNANNPFPAWIGNGGTTQGEWNLTDSTQLKYDGTITTVTGAGQLEINDWKTKDWTAAKNQTRGLTHTMVIENDAKVVINMSSLNIFDKGKMLIEAGKEEEDPRGTVVIPAGKELKTSVANGLVIKGTLIVKDGGTINVKDSHFIFDEARKVETGVVYLDSGGTFRLNGGDAYFAPAKETRRNALSFNTENVDLVLTPAWEGSTIIRKYTVTAKKEDGKIGVGRFEINAKAAYNLINHYMTIGEGVTFTFANSSDSVFSLGPKATNKIYLHCTIAGGGTLEVPSGKNFKVVGTYALMTVEKDGTIRNKGTISIEDTRKLVLEEGAITCGTKPSGKVEGTWGPTTCD